MEELINIMREEDIKYAEERINEFTKSLADKGIPYKKVMKLLRLAKVFTFTIMIFKFKIKSIRPFNKLINLTKEEYKKKYKENINKSL